MSKGMVSAVQRFSTGDGPGIRTTVFLSGCNLRCPWCHNPETWTAKPRLLYYQALCKGCGLCGQACPQGVHRFEGGHFVNLDGCVGCGQCVEVCPSFALQLKGKEMDSEALLALLREDEPFYQTSGGGVTLSGGEPLLQAEFCEDLAKNLRLSLIVDTAANVPYEAFQRLLPYADCFYVDLKTAEDWAYARLGGSLKLVKDNMARLVADGAQVQARIPVIPSYNDSIPGAQAMARILEEAGVTRVSLLPFHRLAQSKYRALGMEYPFSQLNPPGREKIAALAQVFEKIAQVEWED